MDHLLAHRTARLASARTLLFVPADRPERFLKACASGADAVILDLEDAVSPARKAFARSCLAEWLAQPFHGERPSLVVRINGFDAQDLDAELALADAPVVDGLMLPKAQSTLNIAWVHRVLPSKPLLPLIETAVGVHAIEEVARVPGVVRLVFGSVDLMLDLGVTEEAALDVYSALMVLHSRVLGLPAPIDGVTRQITDLQALSSAASKARARGWGGKLCIHPCQVDIVDRAFRPSDEELVSARRIVEAAQAQGTGAIALDGAMIDVPIVLQARRTLAEAAVRAMQPHIGVSS